MTHNRKIGSIRFSVLVVMLNVTLVASYPGVATGQGVPKINVAPSCKAAAAGYAGLNQEFDSCVRSEEAAREILIKGWNNFLASDRSSCHRLTTTGTPGTYTELLTCLEMRRDARALPTQDEIRRRELEANTPRRPRPKRTTEPMPPAAKR